MAHRIKIVTRAGLILSAPQKRVTVSADGALFCESWHMRHVLVENRNYTAFIRPGQIKDLSYV